MASSRRPRVRFLGLRCMWQGRPCFTTSLDLHSHHFLSRIARIARSTIGSQVSVDEIASSRLTKSHNIFFVIASITVGLLALATLLLGASLWGYITGKSKKDREAPHPCQCLHSLPSGGSRVGDAHASMAYQDLRLSVTPAGTTVFTQPKPHLFRNSETDYHTFNHTFNHQQRPRYQEVLAESRKYVSTPTTPLNPAAISRKSFPPADGVASPPFHFTSHGSHQLAADLHFLEFQLPLHMQRQVESHAPESFKPGRWHAWKSRLFGRRSKNNTLGSYSESPTPLHPALQPRVYKPNTAGPTSSNHVLKKGTCAPIYTDGYSLAPAQYRANRPVSGPISGSKVTMPHRSDINTSPYVPLHRTKRAMPSGPLYLP